LHLRRGPILTAKVVEEMLEDYGIHHRISSVANPHTNARAELRFKTVKRMLIDIVPAKGILDTQSLGVKSSASVEKHSGQRQQASF
jgi:transposase InsO family protein